MHINSHTIDRIVAGVLHQLAADGDGVSRATTAATSFSRDPQGSVGVNAPTITAAVITADVLTDALNGESRIVVPERAIVTPAAWDIARERGLEIVRNSSARLAAGPTGASMESAAKHIESKSAPSPLVLVVRNTDAVERLWDDLQRTWRRELLGCPDEAAALATSAVCRGEASTVVILAEQTHRAACLANRNDRVKAVAIRDAGDVRSVRKQLRANVWCLDPTGRSWFELTQLLRAISNN